MVSWLGRLVWICSADLWGWTFWRAAARPKGAVESRGHTGYENTACAPMMWDLLQVGRRSSGPVVLKDSLPADVPRQQSLPKAEQPGQCVCTCSFPKWYRECICFHYCCYLWQRALGLLFKCLCGVMWLGVTGYWVLGCWALCKFKLYITLTEIEEFYGIFRFCKEKSISALFFVYIFLLESWRNLYFHIHRNFLVLQ